MAAATLAGKTANQGRLETKNRTENCQKAEGSKTSDRQPNKAAIERGS